MSIKTSKGTKVAYSLICVFVVFMILLGCVFVLFVLLVLFVSAKSFSKKLKNKKV